MLDQRGRLVIQAPMPTSGHPSDLQPTPYAAVHLTLDAKLAFSVPYTIGRLGGAKAPSRRQQIDGLQKTGLAGSVGS